MKNKSKVFLWVITVFMLLSAFMYFPSVASVLMLMFVAIALPIRSVQDFWIAKHLSGTFKTVFLVALFLVSMLLAPTNRVRQRSDSNYKPPVSDGGAEDIEGDTDPSKLLAVTFDVSIKGEAGRPAFIIKTNLPDETELMLSIDGDDGSRFQDKVIIKDGLAESGQFGSESKPVPDKFSLVVSMPLPSLQADAVRAVIGEKGENLSGEYVEKTDLNGENVISAGFTYDFRGNEGTTVNNTVIEAPPPLETAPESRPSSSRMSSDGSGDGGEGNFGVYSSDSQQNTTDQWVLNTSSMKIHYPSCSQVKKIAPQNYRTSNLSESELKSQGYTTCGVCH